jgi:hypothetical protein
MKIGKSIFGTKTLDSAEGDIILVRILEKLDYCKKWGILPTQ